MSYDEERQNIEVRLRRHVALLLQVAAEDITDETNLREGLGADEHDITALAESLEDLFGVTPVGDEIARAITFGDVVDVLAGRLCAEPAEPQAPECPCPAHRLSGVLGFPAQTTPACSYAWLCAGNGCQLLQVMG